MLTAGTKQIYDLRRHGEVKISKHLKVKEFRSYSNSRKKLYSTSVAIYTGLPIALEKLAEVLQADRISIINGYRCPEHNKAVGGSKHSTHLEGLAADVKFYKDSKAISGNLVCVAAEKIGFAGIGYMRNNTVHLDVSPKRIWRGDETKKEYGAYYSLIKHRLTFEKYFKISMLEINNINIKKESDDEVVEEKLIIFDGSNITVDAINKNDSNFIKAKHLEKMGFVVGHTGNIPVIDMNTVKLNIDNKKVKLKGLNANGTTFVELRHLLALLGHKVDWNDKEKEVVIY